MPREETCHLAAHVIVGIIFCGKVFAMAEDAFDADGVELGFECPSEERMMDPLPRLGVRRKRNVRFGIKQKNGRVALCNVIQGRSVHVELVASRRFEIGVGGNPEERPESRVFMSPTADQALDKPRVV